MPLSSSSSLASSGEYSDFQEIVSKLREIDRDVKNYDDKNKYSPKDYANYLGNEVPSRCCGLTVPC